MKIIKNSGWFILVVLSHVIIYGFVQSMSVIALGEGGPVYAILPLYFLLAGVYSYLIYRWYKRVQVKIESTVLNRYSWLPVLVWGSIIFIQFFLPNDPSVSEQAVIQLVVRQPILTFFMVVVFAPLTEELVYRGMMARYLFPEQKTIQQTVLFLLISSVIFALLHLPNSFQQFFIYTCLGMSLGLAYISQKGLFYSISLHAVNNLIGFLMIIML